MPGTRYTVYRLRWRGTEDGRSFFARRDPVSTHDTAEEADAARRAIEAEGRAGVNPFGCIGEAPFEQTSLPEFALRDWLADAGIDPPPEGFDAAGWRAWWADRSPDWTADQRERAWRALDRVRFAEVEARPAGGVVYAVVSSAQWYNDEWVTTHEMVTTAYRSRERAEAECARLAGEAEALRENLRARFEEASESDDPDAMGEVGSEEGVPAYRVVELPAEGLT